MHLQEVSRHSAAMHTSKMCSLVGESAIRTTEPPDVVCFTHVSCKGHHCACGASSISTDSAGMQNPFLNSPNIDLAAEWFIVEFEWHESSVQEWSACLISEKAHLAHSGPKPGSKQSSYSTPMPFQHPHADNFPKLLCPTFLPQLHTLHPTQMPKVGKGGTLASRQAILHQLVHIESVAVDLAWVSQRYNPAGFSTLSASSRPTGVAPYIAFTHFMGGM